MENDTASATTARLVPLPGDAGAEDLYDAFVAWSERRGVSLYPAQEEAVLELADGANVILATPTGSGKSLVAVAAHFIAMSRGEKTYYTAPLKALVSEKFFALCEVFGPENVGMVTGDTVVNSDAPIVCCTAEILANTALREGPQAEVGQVVMDEFHFCADPDRGWAWLVPLIELPQAQFLLMSATLGDPTRHRERLTRRTRRRTALVASAERPIPLHHKYVDTPVQETVQEVLEGAQAPVYIVHFSQLDAIERAQGLMSLKVVDAEQRKRINEELAGFRFSPGFGKTLQRLVKHGIGVHHAGMLPKYRRLVEQLAQKGLLRIICGTDTLGVGINVPIRTVLLTALTKYDGRRTRTLTAREFHQIAGRAGRAGFDTSGTVLVQPPEHVVENQRAVAKAGDDPKKLRKIVKRKPPEGFVPWSEATFEKLVSSEPEPLVGKFRLSHSMVLNLAERGTNLLYSGEDLIEALDETTARKANLKRHGLRIIRELMAAHVLEPVQRQGEVELEITEHLPLNFALNQPLSPFALTVLELLDPDDAGYALDVLSVFEATLEGPRQVLMAQQKKAKGEAVASMKADGVDYQDRMNRLDEITHPRPLAQMLEAAFDTYRKHAPWVSDHMLQPKSVVRDMYERAMNFPEFIAFYGLSRSEGSVLRYLADAYRTLKHTLPDEAQAEDLRDLVAWLGEIVRQTDSSLLEEWEELTHPDASGAVDPSSGKPAGRVVPEVPPVTANARAFRVLVRNELFRRVELCAFDDIDALGALDSEAGWDTQRWADALDAYWDEHESIGIDASARSAQLIHMEESATQWRVRQVFDDPAGDHDWGIEAVVDLTASDESGFAVVRVEHVGLLRPGG